MTRRTAPGHALFHRLSRSPFHPLSGALGRVVLAVLLLLPTWWPAGAEEPGFHRPPGWQADPAAAPGTLVVRRGFGPGEATIRMLRPGPDEPPAALLDRLLREPAAERGEGVLADGTRLLYARRAGTSGVLEAVFMEAAGATGAAPDGLPARVPGGVADGAADGTASVGASGGARDAGDGTTGTVTGGQRVVLSLEFPSLPPSRALRARDLFAEAVALNRPNPVTPAPLVPSGESGGLEGAFTGLDFEHRPDGEGDTQTLIHPWIVLFDPSGLFSRAAPPGEGGVVRHCRIHPLDCGTYRLLGGGWFRKPDRVLLRAGSGPYGLVEEREERFARRGEDLRIGEISLSSAPPIPPGTLLDGRWMFLSVSDDGLAVRRQLTLRPDGRFRHEELEDAAPANGRAPLISAGRYALDGYRLLLEGDDGRRESFGLVQPDANSSAVLMINGDAYLQQAADP